MSLQYCSETDPFEHLELDFYEPYDPNMEYGELLPSDIVTRGNGSSSPTRSPNPHQGSVACCTSRGGRGGGRVCCSSRPTPSYANGDNPYDPRMSVSSRCWCPGMGLGLPCSSQEIDLSCGTFKFLGNFDECPPEEPDTSSK